MRRTLSTNLELSLYFPDEEVEVEATVAYEYEAASGDGFNEPRIDARVTVESITVQIGEQAVDVLPLYTAKARARMEADLLRREQEEVLA